MCYVCVYLKALICNDHYNVHVNPAHGQLPLSMLHVGEKTDIKDVKFEFSLALTICE